MSDEHEYRRKSDSAIARIEQKLDDTIVMMNAHIDWSESKHNFTEKRLTDIEKVWNSIERPVKFVGWGLTIFIAVIVTAVAKGCVTYLEHHWNP